MHFKVIVIGAGLAGLSAIGRLNELGVTGTLILEARKDIGGRVRMTDFAGSQFNIGPEWLHGQNSNPVYQLAKSKLNLKARDCDDYTYFFNKPELWSILDREKLFKRKLNYLKDVVDDRIMTHNIDSLQNRSISDVINLDRTKNNDAFDRFVQYWAFNYENGSSASDYSALIYRLSSKIYENVPAFSDYCFIERNGFSKIVEHYGKLANLNCENISLNDPVLTIECTDDQIGIITQSHRRYTCDYCILTAPISVLRKGAISITPNLGNHFHDAIKKIPFSTYTRVFVELSDDMEIPNFDWFVDLSRDCNEDISLWQNPRHYIPVMIAHVCQAKNQFNTDINNKVEISLRNILGNRFNSVVNLKVVSLDECVHSFGAFPCATADFNNNDLMALKRLDDNCRLQFAGDSYNLDYFGTVQGAVISGTQSAEIIHGFMQTRTEHKLFIK